MTYPIAIVIAAALIATSIFTGSVRSQTSTIPAARAVVVTTCGTPGWTYTAGREQPLTMNTSGQLCTI